MRVSEESLRRAPLWWILVRHEWRLTVRDFGPGSKRVAGGKVRSVGRKRRVIGFVAVAVLFHVGGLISLAFPRAWTDTQSSRIAAVSALLLLFTLMLSIAMSRVVSAFHERRDLDLLMSAPIAPSLILVIRSATIFAAVAFLFALFIFPLADVGVVTGRGWMARLYLLVPLMAMISTSVALALTGTVVRLVGVRRARVGLQIFSALIGASFYLVSQARQFLPASLSQAAMDWTMKMTRDGDSAWPVDAVARLAAGDPLAWLVFAVGAFACVAASVWATRKRFVELALQPEADAPVVALSRDAVARRMHAGFARGPMRRLLIKEWQLIWRSPQLLSQILLQLLYLLPLLFIAFGSNGERLAWSSSAFAAGIVGVVGTLTASLAWLTVSAEDAPDLLAGSPRSRATLLVAKLVAAVAPAIAILAVAAIGTLRRSIVEAAIVLGIGTLASISAAILEAASPSPGKRSDFQRRQKGRGLSNVVDASQFLLWAAAAGTAASGLWLVALALTIVACVVPGWRLPRALAQAR